jgi:hypothetical protein
MKRAPQRDRLVVKEIQSTFILNHILKYLVRLHRSKSITGRMVFAISAYKRLLLHNFEVKKPYRLEPYSKIYSAACALNSRSSFFRNEKTINVGRHDYIVHAVIEDRGTFIRAPCTIVRTGEM